MNRFQCHTYENHRLVSRTWPASLIALGFVVRVAGKWWLKKLVIASSLFTCRACGPMLLFYIENLSFSYSSPPLCTHVVQLARVFFLSGMMASYRLIRLPRFFFFVHRQKLRFVVFRHLHHFDSLLPSPLTDRFLSTNSMLPSASCTSHVSFWMRCSDLVSVQSQKSFFSSLPLGGPLPFFWWSAGASSRGHLISIAFFFCVAACWAVEGQKKGVCLISRCTLAPIPYDLEGTCDQKFTFIVVVSQS